jgi:hypothetical protein
MATVQAPEFSAQHRAPRAAKPFDCSHAVAWLPSHFVAVPDSGFGKFFWNLVKISHVYSRISCSRELLELDENYGDEE